MWPQRGTLALLAYGCGLSWGSQSPRYKVYSQPGDAIVLAKQQTPVRKPCRQKLAPRKCSPGVSLSRETRPKFAPVEDEVTWQQFQKRRKQGRSTPYKSQSCCVDGVLAKNETYPSFSKSRSKLAMQMQCKICKIVSFKCMKQYKQWSKIIRMVINKGGTIHTIHTPSTFARVVQHEAPTPGGW